MLNWAAAERIIEQHQQDLLHEAERHRLVRQALAGQERQSRFYSRALSGLGYRLVAWGLYLQERYGVIREGAASHDRERVGRSDA